MSTEKTTRWGIIGLGKIAKQFAQALQRVEGAHCYAVASRTIEKARSFQEAHGFEKAYGTYEALIKDPLVEVIYIATPHIYHYENALACLLAGKSVLCEKPLAMNLVQVQALVEAAQANNCFLMEALWTRFLPHFLQVKSWVDQGKIGDVKMIIADLGFKSKFDPESRLFNPKLGGGAWLDIGIYPAFLATILIGLPDKVQAYASFTSTGVDGSCHAILAYPKGEAILSSSFMVNSPCEAHIIGDKGRIVIKAQWHKPSAASLFQQGQALVDRFQTDYKERNGYEYEIEEVQACLRNGMLQSQQFSWKNSLDLMEVLDRVRTSAGIVYEED